MKFIYTRHAEDKFKHEKYVSQLSITKRKIKQVLRSPIIENRSRGEKITAIGELGKSHSLIIIYRNEEPDRKIVITFYPARKGRYESKIL